MPVPASTYEPRNADVVDEHRIARQPLQRRREEGDAQQMLGERQRVL